MQLKCKERIDKELKSRIKDFKNAMKKEKDVEGVAEWINSYALACEDDPTYRGKRLELSCGGPQDYFVFRDDGTIYYHFLDWCDEATRKLYGEDYDIMRKFFDTYLYVE